MTPQEMQDLLALPTTGVLTTLDANGWPHSTAMWFVAEESAILMWTYRRSQKAVNLGRDPRAAFLVEDGSAYAELRGVLIRGRAELIEDPAAIRAIGLGLFERYTKPGLDPGFVDAAIVEIERQTAKRVGLKVPFAQVASWDHRKL